MELRKKGLRSQNSKHYTKNHKFFDLLEGIYKIPITFKHLQWLQKVILLIKENIKSYFYSYMDAIRQTSTLTAQNLKKITMGYFIMFLYGVFLIN